LPSREGPSTQPIVCGRQESILFCQGFFWAGIAATFVMGLDTAITVATIAVIAVSAKDLAQRLSGTKEGGGALFMRGVEFGAAGLVPLLGAGLLFGYLAAERVTCF
jgi:nickel/cobalt transporter (NicO) family protein